MGKSSALLAVLAMTLAAAGEATAQASATPDVDSGAKAERGVTERVTTGDLRKKKCPVIIRDPLCDEDDDDDVVSPDAAAATDGDAAGVPRDPASGLATGKRQHKP